MNKETSWYSVMWRNWRNPEEDQRLSCDKFPNPVSDETYTLLRYGHGVFVVVDATSDEAACDKAGKIFDLHRGELSKELTR